MSFPEPRRGIQKKRVVSLSGGLRYRERCGVSELVALADDELVEAVARVEARLRRGERCVRL